MWSFVKKIIIAFIACALLLVAYKNSLSNEVNIQEDKAKNLAKLMLDQPPTTDNINVTAVIKVAVLVGKNGSALRIENRYNPSKKMLFKLAEAKVKAMTFDKKLVDGQAQEYWLEHYAVSVGKD